MSDYPRLSDRPLLGRPDDLAAENREIERLRAQHLAVVELLRCDVDRLTAPQLARIVLLALGVTA